MQKAGLAAAAGPLILTTPLRGSDAPSNRLSIGAIGVSSRSQRVNEQNIGGFEDARIIACADPVRSHREKFSSVMNQKYGGQYCEMHHDFRELLARPDIDAVTICTPDHWHVSMAAAAIQAGKDVYLEKPLSLSLDWTRRLRPIVAGSDRIFQFGTQQRSDGVFQKAVNLVRNGYIGELKHIDAWCPELASRYTRDPQFPFGNPEAMQRPDDVDFDLWSGPSPLNAYNEDRLENWFHIYDYCLGFISNWGVHPLDIAQWGNQADDTGPVSYEGIGTLPAPVGLYNTVEHWDVLCRYANGVTLRFMSQELAEPVVRRYHYVFRNHGTTFHGSDGWVSVDRNGLYSSGRNRLRKVEFSRSDQLVGYGSSVSGEEQPITAFSRATAHQRNFINAIRTRQTPISSFESAVRSDTIVQLADICLREKEPLQWDPVNEEILGRKEHLRKYTHRPMREPFAI